MSRIGKKSVIIPPGVEAELIDQQLFLKGPKGSITMMINDKSLVSISEVEGIKKIEVKPSAIDDQIASAMWGTTRALIANMVTGVTVGFSKTLEVVGVGYKVNLKGSTLVLEVGFSHPVEFKVPAGITVQVDKNTITVTGVDRQLVGQVTAEIRNIRKPEPYKGKGIKYSDETIRRKVGKAAKSSE